ncbi:hypothetical protein DSO57_1024116 [Entomophthora muscae]|uniref:Uncharacterized protein n=1 Tax=Entomophthora muscae TaxID=34485 RepID=A0ACC2U0J9_9FUNG|nr:hypothetical protein DSO57_1024116 [Entomophthora muscae]
MDRVSIRLQAGIGLLDLLKHSMSLTSSRTSGWCTAIAFMAMCLYHMYIFLNICMALNLHLAVVLSKRPSQRWELCYWLVSLTLPFLLDIPPLLVGMFGLTSLGSCGLKKEPLAYHIVDRIYSSAFSILTITYCFTVSCMVMMKLKSNKHTYPGLPADSNDPWDEHHAILCLKDLIVRTCLYPLVCFLSYIGGNVALITHFVTKDPISTPLKVWLFCSSSSRGLLHLLAFLADPAVYRNIPKLFPCHASSQETKVYQIQVYSECGFSYNDIVAPATSDSSTPLSRKKMIADFHHFI